MPLRSGDLIALYTDGVVEAPGRDGAFFGETGLMEAIHDASGGPTAVKNAVMDAVTAHVGGSLAHDDVTFMVIRVR